MPTTFRLQAQAFSAQAALKIDSSFGIKRSDVRAIPWVTLQESDGFRKYFVGSALSDFGTWLQNSAQVLLAYQLAHSVLAVGLVTFAQFTSPLLLAPLASFATHRLGSLLTLLATQVLSAAVAGAMAGLAFSGAMHGLSGEELLASGAVISGLAFTFALPARGVTVQRLVPAGQLTPAYGMDTVSYNLGRWLAPLLTLLMATVGINLAYAFAANAASFVAFSLILWRLHMGEEGKAEQRARRREGILVACRDRRIVIVLAMVAAVTLADDPILVLGPERAQQLGFPPGWASLFIAMLGAGTVAGSFRKSKHQPNLRLAATALAALALCMLFFVFTSSFWIAAAAALGAGACCLVANSVSRAVLTALAPKGQSAAIMAAWAIAWAGSKPFASLIDGVLGSTIGVQWTGLILAFPALIPVVVILALPGVAAMLAKPGKAAARAEQTRQDWSITQNLWPLPSHKSFPVQPVSCS